MFPAHPEPYVSFHLSASCVSTEHQPGVCEPGKCSKDLGLPRVWCCELALKESLQTLDMSRRKTGPASYSPVLEGRNLGRALQILFEPEFKGLSDGANDILG